MKYMEDLEDMLCDELKEIVSKGKITAGDLDNIDKLTHSIKSIETVMAMDDYSNDYPTPNMSYGYSRNRDSMGRYSRNNGNYSRRYEGNSYGKEGMLDELQDMMASAGSEKEREAIRHCINQIDA